MDLQINPNYLTFGEKSRILSQNEKLLPTGSNTLFNGSAVGGYDTRLRSPADSSKAKSVKSSWEHPFQDAAAGCSTVVRVDNRQLVLRSPLQVEVIIIRTYWTTPGDLQGGVGDSPEQEEGRGFGSWR